MRISKKDVAQTHANAVKDAASAYHGRSIANWTAGGRRTRLGTRKVE